MYIILAAAPYIIYRSFDIIYIFSILRAIFTRPKMIGFGVGNWSAAEPHFAVDKIPQTNKIIEKNLIVLYITITRLFRFCVSDTSATGYLYYYTCNINIGIAAVIPIHICIYKYYNECNLYITIYLYAVKSAHYSNRSEEVHLHVYFICRNDYNSKTGGKKQIFYKLYYSKHIIHMHISLIHTFRIVGHFTELLIYSIRCFTNPLRDASLVFTHSI